MATSEEWAWLAGIVDGEGCVQFYWQMNQRRCGSWSARVTVGNAELSVLEECQRITGAGHIRVQYRPFEGSKGKRTVWAWHLHRKDTKRVLLELLPYLRTNKRLQAELVLRALSNIGTRGQRRQWELSEMQEIANEVKRLKHIDGVENAGSSRLFHVPATSQEKLFL